jgi:hypothetical protein
MVSCTSRTLPKRSVKELEGKKRSEIMNNEIMNNVDGFLHVKYIAIEIYKRSKMETVIIKWWNLSHLSRDKLL